MSATCQLKKINSHEIHDYSNLNCAESQLRTPTELEQLRIQKLNVCIWTPRIPITT